jgi:hypothetical protein
VEVELGGGARTTLCGSHALMHGRAGARAQTEVELRTGLAERRGRRDRRQSGDALGAALAEAFNGARRAGDRRAR